MKNNEFPKKLGSLFQKRKEIKFKTFPINFKVIPSYPELFESRKYGRARLTQYRIKPAE